MPHPATRRTDLTPNSFSSNDRAIVCRRRPPRNSADVAHSLHFPYESILNFVLSRFLLSNAACNYFTFSFPNDSSNLQLFASRRIVSLLVSAKRKIIVNNLLITNFNHRVSESKKVRSFSVGSKRLSRRGNERKNCEFRFPGLERARGHESRFHRIKDTE